MTRGAERGSNIRATGTAQLTSLVCRMATGNAGAMDSFYDLTCARAYGFVCRLVDDPLAAQIVLHNAYVDAWARIRQDRPDVGREISWFLALVFQHCPGASGPARQTLSDAARPAH